MAICSTDPQHPDFAKLKVRWHYQKRDLFKLKLSEKELKQISDDVELFPTQHYQNVYVQTINARCKVKTLAEFEESSPNPPDTYFTRAEFDEKKRVFKPDFKSWAAACSCKMPINPQQLYIGCEACDGWFHPECEGVQDASIENFVCSSCKSH